MDSNENQQFINENLRELKKQISTRRMLGATVRKNFFMRVFRWLFYYCLYIPVFAIFNKIKFRLKIIHKKHLKAAKKSGGVLICNHVHKLDNTFCALSAYPRKVTFTSLPSNFDMKGAGGFLKLLGVVPTPENFVQTRVFFYALGEVLKRKKLVHFYPEGALNEYDTAIRDFHNGAFFLAATAAKPVVPMRIVYRERKNHCKKPHKKPYMSLHIGQPLYPQTDVSVTEAAADLKNRAKQAVEELHG
ncbi:MAG: 1-acyl-sn-glycerol-3-phosphate acyltransferase [Firmicutes bacterium]|nr:1-acyl-sn-glycerol-3-phosphate acyltransferase [Bacillota bacterium]